MACIARLVPLFSFFFILSIPMQNAAPMYLLKNYKLMAIGASWLIKFYLYFFCVVLCCIYKNQFRKIK